MIRHDFATSWRAAVIRVGGLALALAADLFLKLVIIPLGDAMYLAMSAVAR